MSVHAPGDAFLELTSLGAPAPATRSFLQPTSSRDSRLARRRAVTKADINRDLQRLEEEHVWYRQVQMALAGYTLVRIVANLVANLYAESDEHQQSHPAFHAIFRPIVTGLGMYVFLCKKDLFRQGKPLHTWSFRTACCLALPLDGRLVKVLAPFPFIANGMITLWQVLCNVLSVFMTTLKIQAVGWRATANLCNLLTATGIGALVLFSVRYASKPCSLHPFDEIPSRVIKLAMFNCFCTTFATLALQVWSLCCAASTAVMQAQGETTIMSTAYILYANSVLVILGPALSFAGLFARTTEHGFLASLAPLRETLVTLDVIFQVCNVLFLSGMIGPVQRDLETLRSLAELSGYGLASKRIAFPGHISENAPDCIVSFPGKYGDRWDHAVRNVTESGAFSLACVFFTDTESGLGQHATNPETGECWCHEIYGPMSAPAYVRLVDMMDCNATTLSFEMEDAKAMGKLLRVRHGETDMEWKVIVAQAMRDAESLCVANGRRAPWGCKWFDVWKKNVDRAAALRQTLHVFYFEGAVGKGKMAWENLHNEAARDAARKGSGLGASQTAEVAYLDEMGLRYEEHDIAQFEVFLTQRKAERLSSCEVVASRLLLPTRPVPAHSECISHGLNPKP